MIGLSKKIKRIAASAIALLLVFAWLGTSSFTKADINPLYNFKGRITDATNVPVADGVYNFSFGLFTQPTGGAAIWSETLNAANMFSATISSSVTNADNIVYTYAGAANANTLRVGQPLNSGSSTATIIDFNTGANTVTVTLTGAAWADGASINNRPRVDGGIADINLGAVTDPSNVNFDQSLYLEITFNGEIMLPRKNIVGVPQAFNAAKVGGRSATDFGSITGTTTVSGLWNFANSLSISTSSANTALSVDQDGSGRILELQHLGAEIFNVGANGFVGIGTGTPLSMLSINGDVLMEGSNRYLNFGTASGTAGYGLRDNAGVIEFKNSGGGWSTFSSGGTINAGLTGQVGYYGANGNIISATSSLFINAGGFVGVGTTTPEERLVVDGNFKLTGDILPATANQSIGSVSGRILNGYFTNLDVLNMSIASTSISGSASNVFTINSGNVTNDAEDSSLAFHRGSAVPEALLTWNSTADRFEFNFPVYSGVNNILTLGNIGIGTTTPSVALSVGANAGQQFLVNNSGIVSDGTWQGDPIAAAYGGTGQNSSGWTGFAFVNGGVWSASSSVSASYLPANLLYQGNNITLLTNNAGFITATSADALVNKTGNISMWINNAGYITSSSAETLTNKSGQISMWTNDSGYLLPASIANFITATSSDTFTNKSGNISMWTNNVGYITSSSAETLTNKTWQGNIVGLAYGGLATNTSAFDGLIKISGGNTTAITDNSANWNAAFGWGNHATYGYITSSSAETLTNKTWQGNAIGSGYGGTGQNSSGWTGYAFITGGVWSATSSIPSGSLPANLVYQGDDISWLANNVGYITSSSAETLINKTWQGNIIGSSYLPVAVVYQNDDITRLVNNAGYITSSSAETLTNKSGQISMWTNDAGYISSYVETDPIYSASAASAITVASTTNWTTAYGWGNHALAGYITDGNVNWDNSYGFITASSSDTLTNKTWNGNVIGNAYGGTGTSSAGWSGYAFVTGGVWSATSSIPSGSLPANLLYQGDNISWLVNNIGYITSSSAETLTNKAGLISMWTNDAGYLTSYSETDPIYAAAEASKITSASTTNWNTAYGWGNHATYGYITDGNTNWDNSYGYITSSSAETLTNKTWQGNIIGSTYLPVTVVYENDNITRLTNNAGYITSSSAETLTNKAGQISMWTNDAGYISSYVETDPIYSVSAAASITAASTTNWTTAYGWGNHALAGYITDGNVGWDNSYGFITASSSDTLTNKTWNGNVISVAYGGTGTSTQFTEGSIIFAGENGSYSQDYNNLNWNYGNNSYLQVGQAGAGFSGGIQVSAGTAALPSLKFTNSGNSGFFEPSDGQIAYSFGSSEKLRFNYYGLVIGTTTGVNALTIGATSSQQFLVNNSGAVIDGTWQGDVIGVNYGGTGQNSSGWTGYAFVTGGVWSATSSIPSGSLPANLVYQGDDITWLVNNAGYITSSSAETLVNKTWNGSVIDLAYGGLATNTSAFDGLIKISGGITSYIPDSSANWNTAYGWGNHATYGYITSSSAETLTNKIWNANVIGASYGGTGTSSDGWTGYAFVTGGVWSATSSIPSGSLPANIMYQGDNISLLTNDSGYLLPADITNFITASSSETLTNKTWQGNVIDVAYGGTGTSTAFTPGSIVFAGVAGAYSQDNASLFWDAANQRLGLGTAVPGYPLDLNKTFTATSGNQILSHFQLTATPSGTSTATYMGNLNEVLPTGIYKIGSLVAGYNKVDTTGMSGSSTNAYGTYNQVERGFGGIANMYGNYNYVYNPNSGGQNGAANMYGQYNYVYSSNSSRTVGLITGTYNNPTTNSGNAADVVGSYNLPSVNGGTVANTYGSYNYPMIIGSTATNAYGSYNGVFRSAGTLANAYGVYIADIAGIGTNSWSLYASGTASSYLGGNLGIGSTTPSAKLSLKGTAGTSPIFDVSSSTNASLFRINASGNVGIGNFTPTYALDVKGGIGMSSIANPVLAGSITGLGGPRAMAISGRYAYVAGDTTNTFYVIDINRASAPAIVGTTSLPGFATELDEPKDVKIIGRYAYVLAAFDLTVVDISKPTSPTIVGSLPNLDTWAYTAGSFVVSGNYGYIADSGNNQIVVVDLGVPTQPKIAKTFIDNTYLVNVSSLAVKGNYLYALSKGNQYLSIIDISNPRNPAFAGNLTSTNFPSLNTLSGSLAVGDGYAYVVDYNNDRFTVVNIASTTNPVISGTATSTLLDGAEIISLEGKYAYVGTRSNNGLAVVDVSNPSSPTVVASVQDATNLPILSSVLVVGKYAYCTSQSGSRFTVMELAGADIPTQSVGSLYATKLNIGNDAAIGNNLVVQGGFNLGGNMLIAGESSFAGNAYFLNNLSIGTSTASSMLTVGATSSQQFLVNNVGVVTQGAWNGSAIGPVYGGTGITAYDAGDMIYASGANALAKLAIGGAGQVLIASSTGLPEWGAVATHAQVDLAGENYLSLAGQTITANPVNLGTTNVTGVLGVANGGTGTSTAFTPGSIVFAGTGGAYNQSGNFFWDNANGYLGIGTSAPMAQLDITGTSTVASIGPELISLAADRDFSSDTGNWSGTNWTISSGVASHSSGNNLFTHSNAGLTEDPVPGELYQISFDATTTVAGTLYLSFGGAETIVVGQTTGPVSQTQIVKPVNTSSVMALVYSSGWTGSIDNISVKKVTISKPAQIVRNSDGSIGLEIRAAGAGLYSTFVGQGAGSSNISGTQNSFFGSYAGRNNTTGGTNTFVGSSAGLLNVSGYSNVFVGFSAGSSNINGYENVFVGNGAGGQNSSGYNNSFFGPYAAQSNSTGHDNSVFGRYASYRNSTGNYNSIFGTQAALGVYPNSFSNNSIFGYRAGYGLTTGSNNIFFGYQAGDNVTSGANNIIIGYDVNAPGATLSNQLNIGNAIYGNLSNGYVAIGTSTASSMLTVGATSSQQFLVNNLGVVTGGTWQGGVIGIAYGGTGTSTAPTYGQLLMGNASGGYDLVSTSSLGLVSGSVVSSLTGTAAQVIVSASSGAVTLSLPQNIANTSNPTFAGLSLSGLTSGSLLFAAGGGLVSQDNANFFWDNTNKRLGIGTNLPGDTLDIFGAGKGLRLSYDGSNQVTLSSSPDGELNISSSASTTSSGVTIGNGLAKDAILVFDASTTDYHLGVDNTDGLFKIGTGSALGTNDHLTVTTSGYIGIGTTTPSAMLSVGATSTQQFLVNDLGVVTAGTWQGSPIGQAYGGTGTSSVGWTGYAFVTGGNWSATSSIPSGSLPANLVYQGDDITWLVNNAGYITSSSAETLVNKTWNGSIIDLAYGGLATNTSAFDGFVKISGGITTYVTDNSANWNTAYGWGNHASSGYLTSFTETDPIFVASEANNITAASTTNWNTAYGWGNHALAGYIVDGNTNWDNLYGFITATSSETLTNKTWNGNIIDVAYGGTGTSTAFTPGSIVFVGGGGAYSQDNNNFFWDSANGRLGIGTNNPQDLLDIYGAGKGLRLSYDGSNFVSLSSSPTGELTISNSASSTPTLVIGSGQNENAILAFDASSTDYLMGLDTADGLFKIGTGNTLGSSTVLTINPSGYVSIGTTSSAYALGVNGEIYASNGVRIPNGYALNLGASGIQQLYGDTTGFRVMVNYNSLDAFHILNSGNVGIGTNTPSAMLTVGATSSQQFLVNNLGVVTGGTWQGNAIGVAYGGTGTSTAFTAGSIVFAGAGGSYSQNNDNFFWNNASTSLRVGSLVATNTAMLQVNGSVAFTGGSAGMPIADGSSGNAMFWIPNSGTFVAGYSDDWQSASTSGTNNAIFGNNNSVNANSETSIVGGSGNVLSDDDGIASASVLFGTNNTAAGGYLAMSNSLLFGNGNTAINALSSSLAFGDTNNINEILGGSIVGGSNNDVVEADSSLVFGEGNNVDNNWSGVYVIGASNIVAGGTDRSFVFGNGNYLDHNSIFEGRAYMFGDYLRVDGLVNNAMILGAGISTSSPLTNNTDNSLMIGYNSTVPGLHLYGGGASTRMAVGGLTTSTQVNMLHVAGSADVIGNFGIGTTTPSAMLTVGATSTQQFLVNNLGVVTGGTWQGGVIGIAYGGTGTSTAPTYGQLLMGNGSGGYNLVSTSSLGLVSGSVVSSLTGTAAQVIVSATSGAVTLSLPQNIANTSNPTFAGLSLSGLTSGSLLFAAGGGLISQDNANFFYDSTNHRLGLGTVNPQNSLDIFGAGNGLRLSYDGANFVDLSSTAEGNLSITSSASSSESVLIVGSGLAQNSYMLLRGTTTDYYAGQDAADGLFKIGAGNEVGTGTALTVNSAGDVTIGFSSTTLVNINTSGGITNIGDVAMSTSSYVGLSGESLQINSKDANLITDQFHLNSNFTDLGLINAGTWQGNAIGVAYGGTGTSTAFTSGSIVFAGAGGAYSQDNANLSWDNTGKTFQIGTPSRGGNYYITAPFEVWSSTTGSKINSVLTDVSTIGFENTGIGAAILTTGSDLIFKTNATYGYTSGDGDEKMRITTDGNVGIGTTTPSSMLTVGATSTQQFLVNSLGVVTGGTWQGGVIGVAYGGTGTSTAPTNGQLLMGNASGGYNLVSTSSLGIAGTQWSSGAGGAVYYNGGSIGIGTSSPAALLNVYGSSEQLRLSYDNDSYAGMTVDNSGNLSVQSTGGYLKLNTAGIQNYLQIFDATGSNYIQLTHNGTNGLITTNTGNIELGSAGDLTLGNGVNIVGEGDFDIKGSASTSIITLGDTSKANDDIVAIDASNWTVATSGMINASFDGVGTKVVGGTVDDTSFTNTAFNGLTAIDSSNGRIYFRYGGAWHYVNQTGGFQIPNFETAPMAELNADALAEASSSLPFEKSNFPQYLTAKLAAGDLLIPYVDQYMSDGAVHGLYARFDDVKAMMFADAFVISQDGTVTLGSAKEEAAAATTTNAEIQVVTATTSVKTAFVVNQAGAGDVADFKAQDVSVMTITDNTEVKVVGTLDVNGRVLVCAGGICPADLRNNIDETMGDMGVEGKIIAGSFQGYCEDGFVWVPGSAKYGTMPGFCVMSDLAQKVGTSTVPAVANGELWNNISQGESQLACQSLGSSYHLLSENEWLTLAENISRTATNDTDKDAIGLQLATASTTYVLSNGNMIYNLAGTTTEWTDQTVLKAGLPAMSDGLNVNDWQEYSSVIDYKGMSIAPAYYLSSANGIGKILTSDNAENLRGFIRGYLGVYGLDVSNAPTAAKADVGFRCAK